MLFSVSIGSQQGFQLTGQVLSTHRILQEVSTGPLATYFAGKYTVLDIMEEAQVRLV